MYVLAFIYNVLMHYSNTFNNITWVTKIYGWFNVSIPIVHCIEFKGNLSHQLRWRQNCIYFVLFFGASSNDMITFKALGSYLLFTFDHLIYSFYRKHFVEYSLCNVYFSIEQARIQRGRGDTGACAPPQSVENFFNFTAISGKIMQFLPEIGHFRAKALPVPSQLDPSLIECSVAIRPFFQSIVLFFDIVLLFAKNVLFLGVCTFKYFFSLSACQILAPTEELFLYWYFIYSFFLLLKYLAPDWRTFFFFLFCLSNIWPKFLNVF